MSATTPVSIQMYDRDGTPLPQTVSREHLLKVTLDAYERSGTHLGRDVVDLHLLDTVDKAACSLLRDQWKDSFPVAAYTELLTTIAALRSILGYSPTPTAVEVNQWARDLRNATREASGQPADLHEVRIVEGPHLGILLGVWGPKAPQEPDTLAGPPLRLELPTECGDSTALEYGTAHYKRLKRPHPTAGHWEYMLDRGHPFPAEGSRPCFVLPTNR